MSYWTGPVLFLGNAEADIRRNQIRKGYFNGTWREVAEFRVESRGGAVG